MILSEQFINDLVGESHQALTSCHVPDGVFSYLTNGRGLKEKTIKTFGIGFCNSEHEKRINHLFYKNKTRSPEVPSQHIRERIVIPIRDDCGKTVSFATRPIGGKGEWWNYPFTKGNYIFGLNESKAACFHSNKMVLVEGYFDQIVCFQEGLQNVGSPMGTRLSLVQVGLVLRYCDRMCLCFDADIPAKDGSPGPGQRAMLRILSDDDVKNNLKLTAIRLPIGEDPDEFILRKGVASLLSLES